MCDIYISYAHADEVAAQRFKTAFEEAGYSVCWGWGTGVPIGRPLNETSREQLDASRCIVVLWSERSADSDLIKDEARIGAKRETLVSVRIEKNAIFPYHSSQFEIIRLFNWKGDTGNVNFKRLLKAINKILKTNEGRAPKSSDEVREGFGDLPLLKTVSGHKLSVPNIREPVDKEQGKHLFICYAREDEVFALNLADKLKDAGVPVWIDKRDIPRGADWDLAIEDALHDASQFLIILSPTSVKKREVRGELRVALDENKRIFPVLYQPCRIPRQLRLLQWTDFTQNGLDDEATFQSLVRDLKAP